MANNTTPNIRLVAPSIARPIIQPVATVPTRPVLNPVLNPILRPTLVPVPTRVSLFDPVTVPIPPPKQSPTIIRPPTVVTTVMSASIPLPKRSPSIIRPPIITTVPANVPPVNETLLDQLTNDNIVEYAVKSDKVGYDRLLNYLDDVYHNDESDISDEVYDELIDIYETKYGQYLRVGAEPRGERVDLPYYLGSLAKVKEEQILNNYLTQYVGPYIVQDKVDGLAWLIYSRMVDGRRVTSIYTRGGGYRGVDVSHFLNYVPFPVINEDIAIRGEVVMHKDTFARVGTGFKNARNLVSGLVNSKKTFNPELARRLTFYAYRIMDNTGTPLDDITQLQAMGFNVPNPVTTATLSMTILTDYYNMRKQQAPYEMDGLVIYQNQYIDYPYAENPRQVVAFKLTGERAEVVVTGVTWNASRRRLLKPIINYSPVFLSGGELTNASGFNARYIINNNIGPDSRIIITRSGDAIPHVLAVITPSPTGPELPDMDTHGAYGWNANQVEFVLFEDNKQVVVERLLHFLRKLDVKHVGRSRIASLVAAGIEDIASLLRVTSQQLAQLPGIGPGVSTQLYNDMHARIRSVPLARIMDASGIFPNVGEKRFDNILAVYPTLLGYANEPAANIAAVLRNVHGIDMLADDIAPKLPIFAAWLAQNPMITVTVTTAPARGNITVVFSGFRDKELEERLKQRGIRVTTAVSGTTNYLIMKDISAVKGKGQLAQIRGVELITREDAISRLLS